MKRLLLLATAASAVALSVAAPAAAQSWQAINQRQASIDQRIDQGIRSGSLTQQEGIQLRGEFRAIANLEADYRRTQGGLSAGERADLDRRFDQLARRVYAQKQDWQSQGGQQWLTINQRQAGLDQRIDQGVRNGALTQQETILLRGEFRTIANLEAQYRRTDGGLSTAERADLDRRFDDLSRRIYVQKQDRQDRR